MNHLTRSRQRVVSCVVTTFSMMQTRRNQPQFNERPRKLKKNKQKRGSEEEKKKNAKFWSRPFGPPHPTFRPPTSCRPCGPDVFQIWAPLLSPAFSLPSLAPSFLIITVHFEPCFLSHLHFKICPDNRVLILSRFLLFCPVAFSDPNPPIFHGGQTQFMQGWGPEAKIFPLS